MKKEKILIVALSLGVAQLSAQVSPDKDSTVKEIKEVVVTALGVKKEKKALTYSAQEVKGDELTRVKDTNPINSLAGKVGGINIGRSSSGAGGSVKVTLRGVSSTRNNQPLYVVDGVPIAGFSSETSGSVFGNEFTGGNRDGGDVLSMINPDDIESLTVLRGASSAALYGSQGANGVILITTKKGKNGKLSVDVSTSTTFEQAAYLPKLQNSYLASSPGVGGQSWGEKGSSKDNLKDFFNTGITNINSVSLSFGSKNSSTYLSLANTNVGGIMPTNKVNMNTLSFRQTYDLFDGKLKIDGAATLSQQNFTNRPINGMYFNPLVGVYTFPRGEDFESYKNNFEVLDPVRGLYTQNRFPNAAISRDVEQNPYWLLHRNETKETKNRAYLKGSVAYKAADWITFQLRGTYDYLNSKFDKKIYAGTDLAVSNTNGRYILENSTDNQYYVDFLALINKSFSDFDLTSTLGASRTYADIGDTSYADSGISEGLKGANQFVLGAFNSTNGIGQYSRTRKELKSVFGNLQVGYKKMLYLDLTARNDWSSTLDKANNSFFYPSVGFSAIIDKMVNLGENVNLFKIRGSYAEVGNDVPSYIQGNISSTYERLSGGLISYPLTTSFPGQNLKPELKKSYEAGIELRMFKNRLGLETTYYHTNTLNQYFTVVAPANVYGASYYAVTGGDFQTDGMELSLNVIPVKTSNFEWSSTINMGYNDNQVKRLADQLDGNDAILTSAGVNSFEYRLQEGQKFGSIYAKELKYYNGLPVFSRSYDANGKLNGVTAVSNDPNGDLTRVGSPLPNWTMGWNNSFSYKNFTLNVLVDGKIGGKVIGFTQSLLDQAGVTQSTADARDKGNVKVVELTTVNGAETATEFEVSAKDYYSQVGGRANFTGEYAYDLTNFRLAEFSLGYTLKPKNSFIQKANISVIGKNLFFFYKDTPFDPNVVTSVGESFQGAESFNLPSTRSFGISLSANF